METIRNDSYEITYEELCKRCGCTEDERLCIEYGTGDIIKCECDNKWTGYLRGALHPAQYKDFALDDASLMKNHGFSNAEKIFVKKIIVDSTLKCAKTEDILIEEKIPMDLTIEQFKNFKRTRTILSRNETLESLLISHDLNDAEEKYA